MMTWKLDESGQRALGAVERIACDVVGPAAAETDQLARFPQAGIDALRQAGLLGLISAPDVGGQGQPLRAAAAICERLARECPSTAMIVTMHYCATAIVEHFGAEDLRRAIAEQGKLLTLAFSESGSRSHFWVPVSTATPNGNGVKLNAVKQLITAAGHADYYIWSSRPAVAEGLSSIWVVPSTAEGLSIPAPFEGMGLRGNASSPIIAKDVTIPLANRLGEDGKGFDMMMGVVLPWFSLLNGSVSLGMMEGVIVRAVQHVTTSKYAYNGAALAELPQVRGHIARMRIKTDLMRGFLLDALDAVEQGRPDATLRVLETKAAGAETSLEVHDLAMRVCGGAAFRKDVAVERFFRDSRASTVMAPVTDALYDFIGKAACGLPLFDG
ncbi:MAG: acyl-CoA dehydrogenase family protein [Gemmataceae bacterium]